METKCTRHSKYVLYSARGPAAAHLLHSQPGARRADNTLVQAQEGLAAALRAVLCERLAQVGWPPPITSAAAVGEPAGGQPGGQGWHGLEQADAQVPSILRLLVESDVVTMLRLA